MKRIQPTLVATFLLLTLALAAILGQAQAASERPLWPVARTITQWYGWRGPKNGHAGLDIAAPYGSAVYAAISGTVTSSGWDVFGYGNLLRIRGIDGQDYYCAHNSRLNVRAGQRVRQGQVIALVGSTGRSSGPHLHFEIRSGRQILNPVAFLPSSGRQLASFRGR